ncbi:hypothetical protein IEQ34_023267 [Dendrobium chrysotoxum]|uniref:Uncharacterized protein n=1 Tax=Dendrobium chrysotoxum TaxID=161865 RepID=A0AAV7FVP9_DENCH|nr:hypothetical protein IEQ34_025948 [Dendrobium chrysotoxum]KAH0440368.1 hypothetical protein IEQ34_025610 [Dendrobium chrysotoxum]KAH0445549.1 hypothetical protein IEQ34_025393 [Dendrobium chrysotoxum]KAH0445561.1 hypothetical protein IEQ34_025327 [Dendrobium chrysotoxum]KAH0445847.1 hypothetical protein IEQ34_025301 [Dendrobium chrysotoxum]
MGLNEAEVNRGAIVKKFRPRARGRSYMRKKQLNFFIHFGWNLAAWPSGKAGDCKSFIPSSNLGVA